MAGCQPAVHENVQDYYGKRVKKSDDLMTNCCTLDKTAFSTDVKEARKLIHPEVLSKNYGCGAVYPEAVEGCRVLDLGSGAGLDCFVLSKLVGQQGHVTGIDMTKEQLEVAGKYIDYHTEIFGFSKPNVNFIEGFIEKLDGAGLEDETFDLIVSNCVINLSPNKEAVLREAYRVLKVGGEMYFSDIYSNQPVPDSLRENKVLWGECLSGALQWRELMKMATDIGFAPPVLVSSTLYKCNDEQLISMLESAESPDLRFCSATYRLIKVKLSEPAEVEDKSLVEVLYKGTISGHKSSVKFSCQAALKVDCPVVMTSSVASLLQSCPRLAPHFTFTAPPSSQGGENSVTLTTPLAQFINIDPFEMGTKSVELAPPKSLGNGGGCCGENDGSCDPAQKSCDPSAKCCDEGDSGEQPPPNKKACC